MVIVPILLLGVDNWFAREAVAVRNCSPFVAGSVGLKLKGIAGLEETKGAFLRLVELEQALTLKTMIRKMNKRNIKAN